jgi:hypothetical protein
MRASRKEPITADVRVIAGDPLNYAGILTPEERVASNAQRKVLVSAAAPAVSS